MKKFTDEDFEKIKEEVEAEYPRKEIGGIYESILHLEMVLDYLYSEVGKKVVIDEMGDIKYREQLRIQEQGLRMRKVELSILKASLEKNGKEKT